MVKLMKIIKLLMVVLLVFGLVACGKTNDPTNEVTPSITPTLPTESEYIELVYSHTLDFSELVGSYYYYLDYAGIIQEENTTYVIYPCHNWDEPDVEAFGYLITLVDFEIVDSKKIPLDLESIFSATLENDIITIIGGNYRNFDDGERDLTRIATITTDGEVLSNNQIFSEYGKSSIYNSITIDNVTYGLGTNLINADGDTDFHFMSINSDGTVNYEKTAEDFGYDIDYAIFDFFTVDDYYFLKLGYYPMYSSGDSLTDPKVVLIAMDSDLNIITEIQIKDLQRYDSLTSLGIVDVNSNGYSLYYEVGDWDESTTKYISETKRVDYDFDGNITYEITMNDRYTNLTRLTDSSIMSQLFTTYSTDPVLFYLLDNDLNVLEQLTFNDGRFYTVLQLNDDKVMTYSYSADYSKLLIEVFDIIKKQ